LSSSVFWKHKNNIIFIKAKQKAKSKATLFHMKIKSNESKHIFNAFALGHGGVRGRQR
jgi:hypothetical protein